MMADRETQEQQLDRWLSEHEKLRLDYVRKCADMKRKLKLILEGREVYPNRTEQPTFWD
jgi:hypothetical protein